MSLDVFQHPCVPSLKSGHCYQHSLSSPQHLGLIFLMLFSFSSSSKAQNVYWSSNSKMYQTDNTSSQKYLLCNTKTNKVNPLIQWANYLGIMQDQNKYRNSSFLTHTAKFRRARELSRFKLPIIYSYASTQQMQV